VYQIDEKKILELEEKRVAYHVIKRVMDIVISFFGLLICLPLLVFVAILMKITSPGPIFYRQKRVGKNKELFVLIKLRTMIVDAEKHTGPIWAKENDERVTHIGRFLRRTRIDELPQFWNVLKGEMSLIGPRPERPHFVEQYKELQGGRLMLKPGLTGMAQVYGTYHTHPRDKWRYGRLYIKNQSLWLDFKILLKTIGVIIMKRGN
jgi:exopolysaccharide biosynthesis polyprenyl glycosylphosphotransferase